jgi:hypothetical protein
MTQGSNFPHFLMGHRRYMYGGQAKTIKPDKRKLVQLFDNPNIRYVLGCPIITYFNLENTQPEFVHAYAHKVTLFCKTFHRN